MAAESLMLIAANAIVLFVLAGVFLTAAQSRRQEKYWLSWCAGNIALGLALVVFLFGLSLPVLLVIILPNLLLVLGFALRWKAAREFAGRAAPAAIVLAPSLSILAVSLSPWFFSSYRAVFITGNLLLAGYAALIVFEFWRDREDRLPSRYGLIFVYGFVGVSFAARAVQGIFFDGGMPIVNPDDLRLQIHLVIGLIHATASGAFALSIAYERSARELREAAMTDELTGIPNRRAFVARLRETIDSPDEPDFAVTVFDVDHFKQINDEFGHGGGDEALRACARTFIAALPGNAFFARIGGEEFAAILPGLSEEQSHEVADRLRRAVKNADIAYEGNRIAITVSAGICHTASVRRSFDTIMKLADSRLYTAKDAGRDRVTHAA